MASYSFRKYNPIAKLILNYFAGLVTAVEQGNVAKVISLLNTAEIDINR